jgi:two-component system, chemotaxis family, CheB/CheR fusion protein
MPKRAIAQAGKIGLIIQGSGKANFLNLEVIPVTGPTVRERCFLLLFEDSQVPTPEPPSASSKKRRKRPEDVRVSQLEQELTTAKEHLQSLLEEHESTNEELRSTSEEISIE